MSATDRAFGLEDEMSALRHDDSFDHEGALAACARGERSALRRIYEREAPVLQVRHTRATKERNNATSA